MTGESSGSKRRSHGIYLTKPVHPIHQFGKNLRVNCSANQGGRRYMEDRVMMDVVRNKDGTIKFSCFGIFDGHGGAEASEFVRVHLYKNIISNPLFDSNEDSGILEAIRQGFLETHEKMRAVVDTWPRTASGYRSTAGTTASIVFIREGKLYIGHVGDSAIYLGKRSEMDEDTRMTIESLTIDHKPEREEERARIMRAGGSVAEKCGVSRVVWTRPVKGHHGPIRRSTPTEKIPFLAVARSLGDLWSYCEKTQAFAVSPEPDLDVIELTAEDNFLVLASDGLTNVMAPLQLMSIVNDQESINRDIKGSIYSTYANHSRALVRSALDNWRNLRADNVTAITVMLDSPFELVSEMPEGDLMPLTMTLYDALYHFPNYMFSVWDGGLRRIDVQSCPLVYNGAKDYNFLDAVYKGPGFLTHEEELMQRVSRTGRGSGASGGYNEERAKTPEDEQNEELMVGEEEQEKEKCAGLGLGHLDGAKNLFELSPVMDNRPVRRAPLHSVVSPYRCGTTTTGFAAASSFAMAECSATYSAIAGTAVLASSSRVNWRMGQMDDETESDEEEPKKTTAVNTVEENGEARKEATRCTLRKRRSSRQNAAEEQSRDKDKLTSPVKRPLRRCESAKPISMPTRCITPESKSIGLSATEFQPRLTRSATRSMTTSPSRAKAGAEPHSPSRMTTPKKRKPMSREITSLLHLNKDLSIKDAKKLFNIESGISESVGRVTRSQSASFVAAMTPSPASTRLFARVSRLKRATPVSAANRINNTPRVSRSGFKSSDQMVPATPEQYLTSRPSALPSSSIVFATPLAANCATPSMEFTASSFVQTRSANLLGSRKRPHNQLSMLTPAPTRQQPLSSGATPALVRMSLSSPSNSTGSASIISPKIHSAPVTPFKASESPVSSSRWSFPSPNSSSYSDSAAVSVTQQQQQQASTTTEADEQPPSKIRRFYGFVRRLVGFDDDA